MLLRCVGRGEMGAAEIDESRYKRVEPVFFEESEYEEQQQPKRQGVYPRETESPFLRGLGVRF
jgi:hypothetical protein